MPAQPLYVVGISAHFHDSACCLLRDGVLVAAAQEERFTRVKQDPGLPSHAFRYCLEEAGITVADVDRLAYYEDPVKKLGRQLWMGLPGIPQDDRLSKMDPGRPSREIREGLGWDGPIDWVDHHKSHAASAYYFSGFDEAAVLTVDGVGEWDTTTYGRAAGDELELFEEVHFPDSLGLLYSTLTGYLGFRVNSGEYKVMGLAPYGQPRFAAELRQLVSSEPDSGQFRLRMEYFDFLRGTRMFSDALCELLGRPPREAESELEPFHMDVARSLQVVLEELLLEKVRWLHTRAPSRNLCMAGGVALNCVANRRILEQGPYEALFVQPAAGDAGGCLGAAAVAHVRATGARPAQTNLKQVYLGPGYRSDEIGRVLDATPLAYRHFDGDDAGLLEAVVDRLAEGKVIGWFQGRMEFGPRALGARSILADPRDPGMRDRINGLVKKREGFRPFAPVVLEEYMGEHFDAPAPSPFMLKTCGVRSPLDLPAITHVDGSARLQTVRPDQSPRLAGLLAAFHERTGCPILLNTSFNVRGEPIVCSPVDALRCFVIASLDALVLGDYLIDRAAVPDFWPDYLSFFARFEGARRAAVSHSVYSFF